MKKITLLLIILFASCETPTNGINESNANTFETNVQTLKDGFINGYEVEDFDKVISIFADSIKYYPSGVDAKVVSGIEQMKENISFYMANFENAKFTEGEGLPGTDVGFWGGNTYPVSQAMSGPNSVRMYGSWNVTNSNTGKSVNFKQYCVWSFNEDGKVHTVTEYLDLGGLLSTFEE
mgnify:CR=1 FL=1